MRVAVVCPIFIQGRSYQENIWAEQLAAMGRSVRAFYAEKQSTDVQRHEADGCMYEIQGVRTRFLPRSTFRSSGLAPAVRNFRPDLIVVCGDKLFAAGLASDSQLAGVPLVSTYSENAGMHEFDWRKKGASLKQRAWAIGFYMTRGGPIRALCRRSRLIIGNTPQAREILLRAFPKAERARIDARIIDMPLGFSPRHFRYVPEVRQRVRREFGLAPADVLVCASSAFTTVKMPYILMIIDALRETMRTAPELKAVVIGFSDAPAHAPVTQRIAEHIDSGEFADRFIKHGFAERTRLSELYNASDIAVFGRASISCQEALGTGVVACFADDGSLNHLVTLPEQGVFFKPGDNQDLVSKLSEAVARISMHQGTQREVFRRKLADAAAWLGYDRIIQAILERVVEK